MQAKHNPTAASVHASPVYRPEARVREAAVTGNRAAPRIAQRRSAAAGHPIHTAWQVYQAGVTAAQPVRMAISSRLAIQRFEDVKAAYEYDKRSEEDQGWLDDFSKIQQLLADESRVWAHLLTLNAIMAEAKTDIHKTLTEKEAEHGYASVKPMFLRATTEPAFKSAVSRGQQFIDLVSVAHGSHTHRLQWCIIGLEIAAHPNDWKHTGMQLYQDSVHTRWRRKVGALPNMWDLIVDSSRGRSPAYNDFTSPENLEKYIVSMQGWSWYLFSGGFRISNLAASYKLAHDELEERKNHLRKLAPRTEKLAEHSSLTIETTAKGQWTGHTSDGPTVLYPPNADVNERAVGTDKNKILGGFSVPVTT